MSAGPMRTPAFWVSIAVLVVSAVALNASVAYFKLYLRKKPIEVDLKVQSVPAETTNWKQVGQDEKLSKEIIDELGTENFVTRRYVRKSPIGEAKPMLELHLAYYTGMVDTVPHVPERCMVGGGWTIQSSPGPTPLPLDRSGWSVDDEAGSKSEPVYSVWSSDRVRRIRLPRGMERAALMCTNFEQGGNNGAKRVRTSGYFFLANGGICARAEDVRLLAFELKTEYAFFMKVQFSSELSGSAEEMAQWSAELLGELLPDILKCVPDWHEVESGNYPPRGETPGTRAPAGRG